MPYQKGAYGPPNKKHDIVVVAVDSFRCLKEKAKILTENALTKLSATISPFHLLLGGGDR